VADEISPPVSINQNPDFELDNYIEAAAEEELTAQFQNIGGYM